MKSKISVLLIITILIMSLCGCGGKEVVVSYNEGDETVKADALFEEGNAEELRLLCEIISGNNDDPESRDNFFYYMLIKIASIAENNEEDKYEIALDVLDTCLSLPLTKAVVSDGLKQYYSIIDSRLTEKTKEYLIGKWKRTDSTLLTGTTVEVKETENGLVSVITGLPDDDTLKFRIGDVKWDNIQFSNHKMFYFFDLTTEEIKGVENYYKDETSAAYIYSGATARINFDNNSITVRYEKDDMTSGASQIWVKVGSEDENVGYEELITENIEVGISDEILDDEAPAEADENAEEAN